MMNKEWYQSHKSRVIIVGLLLSFVLVVSLFSGGKKDYLANTASRLSSVSDIERLYKKEKLSFAGEIFPVENPLLWEEFEKNYSLVAANLPQLALYHKRAALYKDDILKLLDDADIPQDFFYLAVAESALKNTALSRVGAMGIWQFMPETAKEYGLRVDKLIDERRDVRKSTLAAIAYLQDSYDSLENWTLAAASYNMGRYGLARAIEQQRVSSYFDLVLPAETEQYLYRIYAIKYAMKAFDRAYNDHHRGNVYDRGAFRTMTVGAIENLIDFALTNDTSYKHIKTLNPWILGTSLPEGERDIVLPPKK